MTDHPMEGYVTVAADAVPSEAVPKIWTDMALAFNKTLPLKVKKP
jgi:hypothetical protein